MLDLQHRNEAVVVRIRATPSGVLNAELLDGLAAAITYIGPDRSIVLTGEDGVFAPDLPVHGRARAEAVNRLPGVLGALRAHPCPVVAAINGDAIGAGFALAEAADARIMSGGVVETSARRAAHFRPRAAMAAGLVELHCSPGHLLDLALRLAGGSPSQTALAG